MMSSDADPYPRCILLNGTSSSGKTSLAKALQELFPVVFLNFSIDNILYALPQSDLAAMINGTPIRRVEYRYDRLVDGFHAAVAGLLASGNRLIVDNALTRPEWKAKFDEAVAGHRTFRIGVTCDPEEARKREVKRGDRAIGTVDRELPLVHEGMAYDLVVDTTRTPASAIADLIIRKIGVAPI
jgi:chloramphenicol 3-O phosphotransferase